MSSAASTPKGERRRATLIAAASELLAEGGFEAVRHRAVAERAGLPLASTTYYFDSLENLLREALEYYCRSELAVARERLARLPAGHRRPDAVVDLVLDLLLGSDPHFEAVILRYERLVGTGRRPYLRALTRELNAELRQLLAEIFAHSGFFVDESGLQHMISLVDGTVVNALLEADPDPRAIAARVVRDTLD